MCLLYEHPSKFFINSLYHPSYQLLAKAKRGGNIELFPYILKSRGKWQKFVFHLFVAFLYQLWNGREQAGAHSSFSGLAKREHIYTHFYVMLGT